MNFFNKNLKQDKLFIEVNNRLSLSYWMASDIDHFVENFPELINKDILKQIIKNSNYIIFNSKTFVLRVNVWNIII